MMCGVADEGSAALFVCGGGGTDLAPAPWHLPHRRARWHRRADDANAPVCAAGATTPEPDPGVGGREDRLDLSGGQIGVSLLTGAKFGDRMKKIFPEFFVIDL